MKWIKTIKQFRESVKPVDYMLIHRCEPGDIIMNPDSTLLIVLDIKLLKEGLYLSTVRNVITCPPWYVKLYFWITKTKYNVG